MAELKYWVWLSTRSGITVKDRLALLEHFGSPEKIYFARDDELSVHKGFAESLADKGMRQVNEILGTCGENGYRIMTIADADYPERLKNIFDPPLVLYIRGHLPDMDSEAAIGIVGTRSCTPYGIKTSEKIAYEVTRSGGLVVSGLARGIDSAAARGALRAGGKVIGVLGCGIDIVYPAENRNLYEDVAAVGALVSEYPPGTRPSRGSFPARNRILSGLSVGIAVVEAPVKSGALITASRALEQGRDVFAIPGNVDSPSCIGSNGLLREGAIAVMSGWDITECYMHLYPQKLGIAGAKENVLLDEESVERLVKNELSAGPKRQKQTKKEIDNVKNEGYIDIMINPEELSPEEIEVLKVIKTEKMHIDDIIEASGLDAAEVLSALTMLQISGAVTQDSGKLFTSHVSI